MKKRLSLMDYIRQLNKNHLYKKKRVAFTSVLALFVMFVVVWVLRVKGISMANETDCGIEEHIHIEECYQLNCICGLSEGDKEYLEVENAEAEGGYETVETLHAHTEACYEEVLICEIPEHRHTVACVNLESDSNKGDENTSLIPGDENSVSLEDDTEELLSEDEELIDEEFVDEESLEDDEELEDITEEKVAKEELFLADATEIPHEGALTIEEQIQNAYEAHMEEMAKDNPDDRDNTKIITYGDFYVKTATGLRYKNKINEYLLNTTPNPDNGRNISEYQYRDADGIYMRNSEQYRYFLYGDAPLHLVVFRSQYDTTVNDGQYVGKWIYTEDAGVTIGGQQRIDFPDGTSAIYAEISCGNGGQYGDIRYQEGGNRRDFYTYVSPNHAQESRHPDIEISDGGFFKISTTRDFNNGTKQIVRTRYDSFVSEVYKSNVYFKNGSKKLYPGVGTPNPNGPGLDPTDPDNLYCGPDKSIYEHGKADEGNQQYEITCAYNTAYGDSYMFYVDDVDYVEFMVELSLAPMTSVIEHYDEYDNLLWTETKDFAKDDGSYNYTVTPLSVKLGQQSVVDALNKCPNHSGLDFNLIYTEINLNVDQPTDANFIVTKMLDAPDTMGHNIGEFEFELLDSEGTVISTVRPDTSTGLVQFPLQDFPIPGQYKYKIREKIPAGSVQIEPGVYYRDLIIYDGRVIDIVVDVELTNELLAIVENSDLAKNTELKATVHYYIDGVEINMEDPEDANKLDYHNRLGKYSVKDLVVRKQWIGSGTHKDNVTFRILRSRNNEPGQYYSVNERTVFQLDSSNNWEMTFKELPVIIGTDAYSYEVVETTILDYSPSYKREDNGNSIVYTISNISNEEKYLHFEKLWTDDEGNSSSPPSDLEKVSLKLMREYKELEIPINVKIQPFSGGDKYSNEFVISGYVDGTAEFKLETKTGEYQQLNISASNCDCYYDGNTYKVSNIRRDAEIVLRYPDVVANDLIYWCTNGSSFNYSSNGYGTWGYNSRELSFLNPCYVTCWSGGNGSTALSMLSRTEEWNYPFMRLDPEKCIPGEQYSFSAYIMYRMESRVQKANPEDPEPPSIPISDEYKPTELKIQLNYDDPTKPERVYEDIAVVKDPVANDWYQVQNVGFTIPARASNIEIQVNTTEEDERGRGTAQNNIRYVDIYFDDVIIAPYMYKAGVERNSGNLTTTRLFNLVDEKHSVPSTANNWTTEGKVKAFTIEKDSSWKKTIKISDLGKKDDEVPEVSTRTYRYYVVEDPVVTNYKPIYSNDYVAYNDASTPIKIENRYNAYVLPNTGGIGANKIRWLGMLILMAGITPTLINLVRKRGRPSG